ncbi:MULTISPECIES: hypothetical protein [Methylococcus]|uniref:Uncharacterized protein n=1 Tax=Methylococcus capsulatus TaxID=414 RepID=A0ABZ2F0X1_METCP|nr:MULTISPECIES: hypothetical protein [Methylococcus]MDF9391412.1 hypothetical protein [Methylococcus capsulatus]
MNPYRKIYEGAAGFITVPEALRHHRVEVILWPLDETTPTQLVRRRSPPPQFAGRVKDLGDVMSTVPAED